VIYKSRRIIEQAGIISQGRTANAESIFDDKSIILPLRTRQGSGKTATLLKNIEQHFVTEFGEIIANGNFMAKKLVGLSHSYTKT